MPNPLTQRIRKLLGQYDKEVREAFLRAIQGRVNSINMRSLEQAIEARDFNRVLTIAGLTRADLFPLDSALSNAFVAGGQTVSQAAPAYAVAFGFDGRARRAEAWARGHVGGLVGGIVDEQLDMLRQAIGDQLQSGTAPRVVATRIAGRTVNGRRQGGIVGLSRLQGGYLESARAELENLDGAYFQRTLRDRRFDGVVRRAITDGTALSRTDVERITARYGSRMLFHRGETIARTESITALRAGRREGVLQGIEAGAIREERLSRVWSATLDKRTRDDHVAIDGQKVEGIDAPFVLPDGSRMLYPGDTSMGASASQTINCRCYDEYVVDWLRP